MTDRGPESAGSYDYIIVGAGSAGCVLADRLSEDGAASVLVLEAGKKDTNPWIHVPLGYGKLIFNPDVNWCFDTEPAPGLGGRILYAPGGKVAGGSSSINGMVYIRGQREDYEDWRRAGNQGWGWDDVFPYFKRSENNLHKRDDPYHGTAGPLFVSDQTEIHPLCRAFVDSAAALGYPRTDDFNGASQAGVGFFQVTQRRGRRASTARTFLRRAQRRANVSVKLEATAEHLVLDGKAASGVRYRQNGRSFVATARRGVILSAGAINSPAILQRSGIGNGASLQAAGIEVLHHLPGVGANLHDHLQVKLVLRCSRNDTLNTRTRGMFNQVMLGLDYALRRRGALTMGGGQSGGFISSMPGNARPDVQFHVMPFSSADLRKGLDHHPAMTISSCLLRPESRGHVGIRSSSVDDAPIIQPNFLAAESDRRIMVEGLQAARRIASARPLKDLVDFEERPGPGAVSDDDLLGYVRSTAGSVFHPVGTCKMGVGEDSVVDQRLMARGMKGLFVADASIMPSITSGNTNAVAIMIGEKAADLIREEAKSGRTR